MKSSNYIVLLVVITILAGCNNKQKTQDNSAIVGIWQNTTNPMAAIEFTKDGAYYLRMQGDRLLDSDSTITKYSYNPLPEENNLIIYGNSKAGNTQAKLVIISSERIKISLVSQGKTVSEAEFTKVKAE
jgi:uncharacterized lipoprotein NlpE involved in copper resistance